MELLALGKIMDRLPMSSSIDGPLFQTKKQVIKLSVFVNVLGQMYQNQKKKLSMEIVIKLEKLRSNPNPIDGKQTLTILNG